MPGAPGSRETWGEAPLVVDTSAWMRASDARVREQWHAATRAGRLRVLPAVALEILFTARDGPGFDEIAAALAVLRPAPMTAGVANAAQSAMRTLAHRSAGAHRLPLTDYLVAASAQELGAAVLHYDSDYDTLAKFMRFESVWLAPPGSI